MDNKLPPQPTVAPTAPTAATAAPQPKPSQDPTTVIPPVPGDGSSSNKLVMFLILGIIVIGLAVGGIYLYLNQKQTTDLQNSRSAVTTPIPVAKQENLEADLNSINIATDDADFATIDQDIQGL